MTEMAMRRAVAAATCALACAIMAGCATTLAESQEGWLGATLDEVTRAWGQPASSTTLDDGAVERVWLAESPALHGSGSSVGFGFGVFGGRRNVGVGVGTGVSVPVGSGSRTVLRCERRLTFRGEVVVDQVWTGEERYCSHFRRPS